MVCGFGYGEADLGMSAGSIEFFKYCEVMALLLALALPLTRLEKCRVL